jgi:hypothetical protein
MKTRLRTTTAAVMLALVGGPATAIENITLNGFLTAGATYTDSDTEWFDGNITDEVGFEKDSRVGIQVSAQVNPKMTVTAQLLGRARDEDYNAFFDWGFVGYAFTDELEVRGGKIKFPTYLISDYIEVGYAYPWIRPPEEVYTSNPLTAITGIDALWRFPVGNADILIQPYVGTSRGQETTIPQHAIEIDNQNFGGALLGQSYGAVDEVDFEAENLVGINASVALEGFSFRAGYLRTDVKASDIGVTDDEEATFWSLGATMDWHNIVGYAEYFEREIDGAANLGFPDTKGWYTTLGYRIGKWLPHITYAKVEDNDNPAFTDFNECGGFPCGEPLEQDSITAGLRYELGVGAALKFEAQHVDPDGRGLFTGYDKDGDRIDGRLNTDPSKPESDDAWIYSIAVDVVF